jgi:hypothetical protein
LWNSDRNRHLHDVQTLSFPLATSSQFLWGKTMLASLSQLLDALKLNGTLVSGVKPALFFGCLSAVAVVVACFGYLTYCELTATTARSDIVKVCAIITPLWDSHTEIPRHRQDIFKCFIV